MYCALNRRFRAAAVCSPRAKVNFGLCYMAPLTYYRPTCKVVDGFEEHDFAAGV